MMDTRARGTRGETIAAAHLEELGWRILGRNVTYRCGELDLVAWDGGQLVFVEVRSLWRSKDVRAEDSVTFPKQRRLERAARRYMSHPRWRRVSARFDVMSVDLRAGSVARHIQGAFDAIG